MAREEYIIQHLSKEIETHTNSITVFRSRVHLSVYLGPFVVFGYFVVTAKGLPASWTIDTLTWVAIVVVCVCFLALGLFCASVEEHTWNQCNRWRMLIARLQKVDPPLLGDNDLVFNQTLKSAYLIAFLLLLLSLFGTIIILARLSPAGASGGTP